MEDTNTFTGGRVIDISHYQQISNFDGLKSGGVIAVIHKCTEAHGLVDYKYANRKLMLQEKQFLIGSYHFLRCYGRNTGADEAKYFLDVAKPDITELIALDAEAQNLTLKNLILQSESFVQQVYDDTQRYPVFYMSLSNLFEAQTAGFLDNSILANCPLWIAAYRKTAPKAPSTWDDWSLWQYTDSEKDNCITLADGDHFSGDTAELYKFWNVQL